MVNLARKSSGGDTEKYYDDEVKSIDFTPDENALKILQIQPPKKGEALNSLDSEKVYRYQLEKDKAKLVQHKGSFATKVLDFMRERLKDPKFVAVTGTDSQLGINGTTEDVAQVTREISWRATSRPKGTIADKRYKEWLTGTPAGPSASFLKDKEQRKMDAMLWENIKYDRLKKSKKQERQERKERAEAYAKEQEEKRARAEAEKEALAMGRGALASEEAMRKGALHAANIDKGDFAANRTVPTEGGQAWSMRNYNAGHNYPCDMERNFPIRIFLNDGVMRANSEVVKFDDGSHFLEEAKVSTERFITPDDASEWAYIINVQSKNVARAEDFLKAQAAFKKEEEKRILREKRAEERRLEKEAEEAAARALNAVDEEEEEEEDEDGDEEEDEEEESDSEADLESDSDDDDEKRNEKRLLRSEKEQRQLAREERKREREFLAAERALKEQGAEGGADSGEGDPENMNMKKKKKKKGKGKEGGEEDGANLEEEEEARLAALRQARSCSSRLADSLRALATKLRPSFTLRSSLGKIDDSLTQALKNEPPPPPPAPLEPWELPPGEELKLTRSERKHLEKLKRTIMAERKRLWEEENSEEAVQARLFAEKANKEAKKFSFSRLWADVVAFVTGTKPEYAKSKSQRLIEARQRQEKMDLKAEEDNEKAMSMLFFVREKQRDAEKWARDMRNFLNGIDSSAVEEYAAEDLIRECRTGNYNAVIDIIDHPTNPVMPNTPNPEGQTAFLTVLNMVLNNQGADVAGDLFEVSMWTKVVRFFNKKVQSGKLDLVLRVLLYKGGNVDYVRQTKDGDGTAVMHNAAESGGNEMIAWLLQKKAKVNILSVPLKRTPLMLACRNDRLDTVMLLLKNGAMLQISAHDLNKWTALHFAACYASKEVVQVLLLCGAKVNARNERGLLAVEEAQARGRMEMVETLRTFRDAHADHISRLAFMSTLYEEEQEEETSFFGAGSSVAGSASIAASLGF